MALLHHVKTRITPRFSGDYAGSFYVWIYAIFSDIQRFLRKNTVSKLHAIFDLISNRLAYPCCSVYIFCPDGCKFAGWF